MMSLLRKNATEGKDQTRARGFMLIEMLMVLSIMVVFISIVVGSQRQYQSNILASDLVHRIALTIREMQSYGVSVKEYRDTAGTVTTKVGYGVVFTETNNGDGGSAFTFVDKEGATCTRSDNTTYNCSDGRYNSLTSNAVTNNDTMLETMRMVNGASIENLHCVYTTMNMGIPSVLQYDTGPGEALVIGFIRPNPQAILSIRSGGNNYICTSASISLRIGAELKAVSVSGTGYISTTSL
jgi:type II secretory pathway pseudopilin PulG